MLLAVSAASVSAQTYQIRKDSVKTGEYSPTVYLVSVNAPQPPADEEALLEAAVLNQLAIDNAIRDYIETHHPGFQQDELPHFIFATKQNKFSFSLGGQVTLRASYDFDGISGAQDFIPATIAVPGTYATRQKFGLDGTTSRIFLKAIANFDSTKNVRFSTYGVPMIAGELRRYLRDYSPIRVSRSTRDTAYKVLQAKERLTAASGREPTLDEIAKELDIPRRDVVFALDAISDPISLYEPIYTDNGESICVMDQVGDTKNTDEQWLEHLALSNAISDLNEREKKILSLRFYAGKTQMEVAGEIGISQAQVSRLEKNALGKIRKNIFPS